MREGKIFRDVWQLVGNSNLQRSRDTWDIDHNNIPLCKIAYCLYLQMDIRRWSKYVCYFTIQQVGGLWQQGKKKIERIINAFCKFLQAPVRSAWVEWILVLVDDHHRHRRDLDMKSLSLSLLLLPLLLFRFTFFSYINPSHELFP